MQLLRTLLSWAGFAIALTIFIGIGAIKYAVKKEAWKYADRSPSEQSAKVTPRREAQQTFENTAEKNEVIAGGIILRADRMGHFGGTALINGVPMKYMIDTGATMVVIPAKMAEGVLKVGKPYITHTANGEAIEYQTKIDSFKIGNAEIKNVQGGISEKLDVVLVGMSALKNFIMSKDKDALTLIAYNTPQDIGNVAMALQSSGEKKEVEEVKAVKWQKSKKCDEHGENCKTIYSKAID